MRSLHSVTREEPLLSATRGSLYAAMKTQCSQKISQQLKKMTPPFQGMDSIPTRVLHAVGCGQEEINELFKRLMFSKS